MSGSTHLRGIAIAGALAALALAGAFLTFAMNQDASKAATPPTILPLKDRHPAMAKVSPKVMPATTVAAKAKVKAKPKPPPVDPNLKAALAAGLPRTIAEGLAQSPVAVVELSSDEDTVSEQTTAEAKAGAQLGGAAFVSVDVDKDSTTVQGLARLLEQVPDAPAALIYTRPATLALTLSGYVDETVIAQAVANADPTLQAPAGQALVAGSWASQANQVCEAFLGETLTAASVTKVGTGLIAIPVPSGQQGAEVRQLDTVLRQEMTNFKAATADKAKGDTAAANAESAKNQKLGAQEGTLERKLGATTCVGVE